MASTDPLFCQTFSEKVIYLLGERNKYTRQNIKILGYFPKFEEAIQTGKRLLQNQFDKYPYVSMNMKKRYRRIANDRTPHKSSTDCTYCLLFTDSSDSDGDFEYCDTEYFVCSCYPIIDDITNLKCVNYSEHIISI